MVMCQKSRYRNRVEFKVLSGADSFSRRFGRYRNRVEFKGKSDLQTGFVICVDIETEWNLKCYKKQFQGLWNGVDIETEWNLKCKVDTGTFKASG